jgi:hypothetical protein
MALIEICTLNRKDRKDRKEKICQLILKLSGRSIGFLINWKVTRIKDGIQRMIWQKRQQALKKYFLRGLCGLRGLIFNVVANSVKSGFSSFVAEATSIGQGRSYEVFESRYTQDSKTSYCF